jgi:hypothetical protein
MTQFRLGFGPMSREIVDAIATYTQDYDYPLMIIASRNQVDADSGYVMTTEDLSEQLDGYSRRNLWLCRDHCGPYFLDAEANLNPTDAVNATKKTIAADIEAGFDLIHIDTSRIGSGYKVAEDLIKFSLDMNPNIKFEFGTEENVGVAAGIQKYADDVKFAAQFPNMEFVVAQTGSLTSQDKQMGDFDVDAVAKLVGFANAAGVKLKEHNADYLTPEQIQLRRQVGVHALNIAPQLGVMQTRILRQTARDMGADEAWHEFSAAVLGSGKWRKWTLLNDSHLKVDVAGHYLYNSPEYRELIRQIGFGWQEELKTQMHELFTTYAENL